MRLGLRRPHSTTCAATGPLLCPSGNYLEWSNFIWTCCIHTYSIESSTTSSQQNFPPSIDTNGHRQPSPRTIDPLSLKHCCGVHISRHTYVLTLCCRSSAAIGDCAVTFNATAAMELQSMEIFPLNNYYSHGLLMPHMSSCFDRISGKEESYCSNCWDLSIFLCIYVP